MTTTIDTDGRATGQTTPTRVLDLNPGDVVEASWEELAEVRLVEPIAGSQKALLVIVGGHVETVPVDQRYGVVDPARAEKFRAYQREMWRRLQLADQLDDLSRQIRNGDLPMPSTAMGAHLTVYMDTTGDVEAAAKTLGAEIERTDHAVAAVLPDVGDSDLSVRFQRYLRPEVDA